MKTIHNYRYLFLFGLIGLLISCSKEGYTDPITDPALSDNSWESNTNLSISAQQDKKAFVWLKNVLTLEESWGNNEVVLNIKLNSANPISNIDKIDFYITAQEKDGYNYTEPFDKQGKFYTSINSWDEEGKFTLNLEGDYVYSLFNNDFNFDRTSGLVRNGDLFELHWVIYFKDGTLIDSRNSVEGYSRYGIASKVENFAPPVFAGTFIRKWTYMSPNWAVYVGPQYVTGYTENVEITSLGNGDYSLDLSGIGTFGKINYNFIDGLLKITQTSYGDKWVVTNVQGQSLTIDYTFVYTNSLQIYGTFTLTRTDGADWPTNIYTN